MFESQIISSKLKKNKFKGPHFDFSLHFVSVEKTLVHVNAGVTVLHTHTGVSRCFLIRPPLRVTLVGTIMELCDVPTKMCKLSSV